MSVENFYQGEELSARKLNELVCAINSLCSTMQALQRDQTIAGLGQNDRPRMLGRSRSGCGDDEGSNGKSYFLCFVRDTVQVYMPPWGVLGVRRREWDEFYCVYADKTYYYVASGVWKEGSAYPGGTWCEKSWIGGSDNSDGIAGKWAGPAWCGGWIKEPENGQYLFATNEGKLVVSDSMKYDWRYQRLIADLGSWQEPNCANVRYIARNGCTEMLFFPVQYWTGDICQPRARWEQGGMFSVRMNPRTGKVAICGGIALVEGPLAVGGDKTFNWGTGTSQTEINTLISGGGYYRVKGFDSNIPAAGGGFRQYLYLGYNEACDNPFWWFWMSDTVAYNKKEIPLFSWNIATTTEVESCGKYVMCTSWQSRHCNYDSWRMAMPMGVAYSGECGYVCVAVAQHIPQFRARPIINLQNAGTICSTGNDWACESNRVPCGCMPAWVVNERAVCRAAGCINGVYVDVLKEVYVEWNRCLLC